MLFAPWGLGGHLCRQPAGLRCCTGGDRGLEESTLLAPQRHTGRDDQGGLRELLGKDKRIGDVRGLGAMVASSCLPPSVGLMPSWQAKGCRLARDRG